MQRQRFITTIKNMTEKKEKKKAQKLNQNFIVPIKSTSTTEGENKREKKIQKNLQNKS